MTTFAPAAMHACACAFCLSGSLRALLIDADTPAFLNAAFMAGASNCTQRTDDFVSGSRTQTSTLALLVAIALVATTAATDATAAITPTTANVFRETFLTLVPPRGADRGWSGAILLS